MAERKKWSVKKYSAAPATYISSGMPSVILFSDSKFFSAIAASADRVVG